MNVESKWPDDAPNWLGFAVFIGPLAVYLAAGAVIPAVWERIDFTLQADQSPSVALVVAVARLVLMAGVIVWALRWILRVFPFRVTPLAVFAGVLGGAIWIGLCRLNLESRFMTAIGLPVEWLGRRDAINPWEFFFDAGDRNLFLVARFALLVIAVPIAEELMLRGFLMRYLEHASWETLSLDQIGRTGCIAATVYGVLSHPAEWIAAAVWFTLITLLMIRTKRFWDCVVAHSITNAILGAYVLWAQDWRLW